MTKPPRRLFGCSFGCSFGCLFHNAFRRSLAAASLVLGVAASPGAHAQSDPMTQWRPSPMTLATLLQDGFRLVSVLPLNGAQGGQTYYLQRDQSAYRCVERNAARPGAATAAECFELVQPGGAVSGAPSPSVK